MNNPVQELFASRESIQSVWDGIELMVVFPYFIYLFIFLNDECHSFNRKHLKPGSLDKEKLWLTLEPQEG